MKEILLSKGYVTAVDDADYEELAKYKWCALVNPKRKTVYAVRTHKYKDGDGVVHQSTVYMHKEILNLPKGMQGDHKDRNSLNNTRNNLRAATFRSNMQNKARFRNNKSGFKGVVKLVRPKRNVRYIATIRMNGKNKRLGSFKTLEEAALAYDAAAKKLHGEFAVLNFSQK